MIIKLAFVIHIVVFVSVIKCIWYDKDNFRLLRREPVAVGYEREVKLNLGRRHNMKTLSVNPPIFEVKEFLSPEECEYLIFLAKQSGLKQSPIHPESSKFKTTYNVFNEWDVDNSSYIEPIEFTFIKGKGNLYLTEVEVMEMIAALVMDNNNDNRIDFEEFKATTAERIRNYFEFLTKSFPNLRNRDSRQAWISHYGSYDKFIEGFHERVSRLTLLPHELIEISEPMQVVKYDEGGHYHCHHDSDEVDPSILCCTHRNIVGACRQCRYLTVMFFLNNVTKGVGQTAFQVADNKTFSYENWEEESQRKCNLIDNCEESNLVLEPIQGTALLWYNHKVDISTGWIGKMDPKTLHGGCDVGSTEKWIANIWLNIIGEKGSTESFNGWLAAERSVDEL